MKVFTVDNGFGLDHLTLVERPDPRPGPGQVLLRMKAVSLNYRDLLMVTGRYNPRQPLPLTPCSDGVGEVVEVGEGVNRVRPGDRVAPIFAQGWLAGPPDRDVVRSTLGGPHDGTLAELMTLSAEGVVKVPEHLTDVEAATLPCAAVTAWNALVTLGNVGAGDTVLVQGTGGVALFALQLARLHGARVIVTSSSDEKIAAVRELGSWAEINYVENPEWGKAAKELTGGVGVDHVVELGGAATLAQSLRAVRVGGQVSLIGNLAGAAVELNLLSIVMQSVRVQGLLVGSRQSFEDMLRAVDHHRLRPVVDRVFPFAQTPAAFARLESAEHMGKVCIEI